MRENEQARVQRKRRQSTMVKSSTHPNSLSICERVCACVVCEGVCACVACEGVCVWCVRVCVCGV